LKLGAQARLRRGGRTVMREASHARPALSGLNLRPPTVTCGKPSSSYRRAVRRLTPASTVVQNSASVTRMSPLISIRRGAGDSMDIGSLAEQLGSGLIFPNRGVEDTPTL